MVVKSRAESFSTEMEIASWILLNVPDKYNGRRSREGKQKRALLSCHYRGQKRSSLAGAAHVQSVPRQIKVNRDFHSV